MRVPAVRWIVVGVAAVLWIAMADTAQAQGRRGEGAGTSLGGSAEAELLERNAQALGLDEKTLEKVKRLGDEGRSAYNAKNEQMAAARTRMLALLAEDLPDEAALMRESDAIGRFRAEALRERMATSLQIRKLLTPEQRKKFSELRQEQDSRPARRAPNRRQRPRPPGAKVPEAEPNAP